MARLHTTSPEHHYQQTLFGSNGCRVPQLLRGDAPGQSLVRTLGVVDVVKHIYLGLQLRVGLGHGLFIQPTKQSLVEALVLPLGGWLVRLAGDRLDPERGHVSGQLPFDAAPLSVRSLCGTPWASIPFLTNAKAASLVSAEAT